MHLHRLAEARSLAYHRLVAARLSGDPRLLELARARVAAWIAEGRSVHHAQAWAALLAGPPAALLAALTDEREPACALRQSTPFSGALAPAERWQLWRTVREELERG